MVDDEKSAANKTRVLRVEYRREDQYLSIEIQPERTIFARVGGLYKIFFCLVDLVHIRWFHPPPALPTLL